MTTFASSNPEYLLLASVFDSFLKKTNNVLQITSKHVSEIQSQNGEVINVTDH